MRKITGPKISNKELVEQAFQRAEVTQDAGELCDELVFLRDFVKAHFKGIFTERSLPRFQKQEKKLEELCGMMKKRQGESIWQYYEHASGREQSREREMSLMLLIKSVSTSAFPAVVLARLREFWKSVSDLPILSSDILGEIHNAEGYFWDLCKTKNSPQIWDQYVGICQQRIARNLEAQESDS